MMKNGQKFFDVNTRQLKYTKVAKVSSFNQGASL
jgi:hypothetical protein